MWSVSLRYKCKNLWDECHLVNYIKNFPCRLPIQVDRVIVIFHTYRTELSYRVV